MLAAAVLASWWAQADPAPAATPAEAAPVSGPAQAAPAEPAPTPAEPLPTPAPSPARPEPPPDNRVSISGSFAYRVGDPGRSVGPAAGFSLSGGYERRYLTVSGGLELGAALDFFYDKFETGVTGSAMVSPGQEQTYPSERILSQTGFALLQTAAWRWRRLRPFAGAGPGFTIAYFSTPEMALRPGSFDATQPLVRAALGLDLAITREIGVSAHAGYSHLFTRPTFTADATDTAGARTYSFLGDLFDAGLGVVLLF